MVHSLSAAIRHLARHGAFPPGLKFKVRLRRDPRERHLSLGELYKKQFGDTKTPIRELNSRLLNSLRRCAENDLLEQDSFVHLRQQLIDRKPRPALKTISSTAAELRRSCQRPNEEQIARAFLADRFDRNFFKRNYSNQNRVARYLSSRLGKQTLNRWMGPTSVDYIAAFIMSLCDTGWNVGTMYDLKSTGVSKERTGTIVLSSIKKRSRGKRTEAKIEPSCETAELWKKRKGAQVAPGANIERWQGLIEQYCAFTGTQRPREGHYFWVLPMSDGAKVVRPCYFIVGEQWLRAFQARHVADPFIGGLKFSLKNIRPTVLQLRAPNDYDTLLKTQIEAGHRSSATTLGYLRSAEFEKDKSKHIRLFQEILQAAMTRGVPEASVLLEVPRGRLEFLDKLARSRAPSLFSSTDSNRKPQRRPQTVKIGLKCFAASPSAMEALHLSHKALTESVNEGRINERWARTWLPFYALLEAVIERLARSPYARRYREAAARAEKKLNSGAVVLPTVY
jgi:hypothetical protein